MAYRLGWPQYVAVKPSKDTQLEYYPAWILQEISQLDGVILIVNKKKLIVNQKIKITII